MFPDFLTCISLISCAFVEIFFAVDEMSGLVLFQIKALCDDLGVLGKQDFKNLLK